MRELPLAREVERERLVPLILARIEGKLAAAAGVVHEDIDVAQAIERCARDCGGGVLAHEVAFDDHRLRAALRDDFLRGFFEQVAAPGDDGEFYAFGREGKRDAAAYAGACPRDKRGLAFDAQIHAFPPQINHGHNNL